MGWFQSVAVTGGLAEVRAEAVVVRLRLRAVPDKEQDSAYQRNQAYEPPSAGFAYVVETTPCHGQARDEQRESQQPSDEWNKTCHDRDDEVEKGPPPVFGAGSPAGESGVLVEAGRDSLAETHGGSFRNLVIVGLLLIGLLVRLLLVRLLVALLRLSLLLLIVVHCLDVDWLM